MFNLFVSNNTTIGNNLLVSGNTDLQGNLDVYGNAQIQSLNVTDNIITNILSVTTDANISGNLTVQGDMVINGTTTTVNTETLAVEDPIIKLGSNNNISDVVDLGYYGKYVNTGTTYYSGLVRDASDGIFKFYNTQTEPTTIVDFTDPTLEYADVKMNDLDVNGINSSSIDTNDLDVSNNANINNLNVTTNVDIDGTLDVAQATTMGSTLTLTGAADFNSSLDVAGTAQLNELNVSTNVDISQNLTVSGWSNLINAVTTNSTLNVVGAAQLDSTLNVDGATTMTSTLEITDAVTTNSTLNVVGAAQLDSTLNIDDAVTMSSTLTLTGAADFNSSLDVAGTVQLNELNVSTNTDIGQNLTVSGWSNLIGAITTNSTLNVVGAAQLDSTLNIDGATTMTSTLEVTDAVTTNSTLNIVGAAQLDSTLNVDGAVTMTSTLAVTDDFSVDTDTLYIDTSEDKVGINTSTPETSLHVSGTDGIVIPVGDTSERIDVTGAIRYNSETQSFEGYSGTWGSLGGIKDVDGDTYISAEDNPGDDNDELKFFTAGTEKMIINTSGQLGIGLNTPLHLLDINGTNDNSSYSSLSLRNGNNVSTFSEQGQIRFGWNGGDNYAHFIHTRHNSAGINNAIDFYVNDGTKDNTILNGSIYSMTINDGNLGIGITNPTNKLDVIGDGYVSDFFSIGNQTVSYPLQVESINNNSWSTKLKNNNASLFALHTNGNALNIHSGINSSNIYLMKLRNNTYSDIFNVMNDGNVGINTATPSKKLEIITTDTEDGAIIGSSFIGNDTVTNSSMILVNNTLKSNTNDYAIKQDINGKTELNSKTGQDLSLNINDTSFITVKSDGKVGIHTDTPNEDIEIADNVLINSNTDISLTVTNLLSDIYMAQPDGSGIFVQSGTTLNYALQLKENTNDLFIVYNNGNVQLGATQGDNKLSIESGLSIIEGTDDLNINVTNSQNIIQSDNQLLVNISGNDILDIKQNLVTNNGDLTVNGDLNVTGTQYIGEQLLVNTTSSSYQLEVSGDTRLNGDVIISGILSFEGVSVDSFEFQDSLIKLGNNNTDNTEDIGFYGKYIESGTTKYSGLFSDASNDNSFVLFKDLESDPTKTVDTTHSSFVYGDLLLNDIDALGKIAIGTTDAQVSLHISGTDGIVIPVGDITQRVDITGAIRYNTDTQSFEGYNGTWGSLGGVIDVDQDTFISAEDNPGDDNDELKFFTAGTQHMVLNISGFTGIGITNPETSLHISSTNTLVIPVGDITQRISITGGIRYNSDLLSFEGYDGSNWGSLGGVKDVDQDTYISAENTPGSDNDELKFFTANTQHMIIDSTGKVGIGITNPQYALDVDGIIQSNDEILAPEFTATCDIRVKENIKRLDDKFLEKLCSLNLFEYNYTENYSKNNEKMYGLLAQNVEKIIPEAIKTKSVKIKEQNINDFKTISQNTLITYLIGSMQQLTKHHNSLVNQFVKLQKDYIELRKEYDLEKELNGYKNKF